MSKRKPEPELQLVALFQKGVTLEDSTDNKGLRYIIIRIPYEGLLNDKDIQIAFQHLVTISSS
jgi:hypothetical protein